MSMNDTLKNDLLKLIYQATAIADIAQDDGSSPATQYYYALHTADPGDGGDQSTNEVSYTGYARQSAARSASGFTVSGSQLSNAAQIQWGLCTAGSATAMFWSVGKASSGAGQILHRGVMGAALGPFVAESSNDTITIKGHGLSVDDRIAFWARPGDSLPSGITQGTVYWVKTVADGDNITLSATQGGATLDITADGDGFAMKVSPLAISNNVNPTAAIGALVHTLD